MKKTLLLFFYLLPLLAISQKTEVTGWIKDMENNPVPYPSIVFTNSTDSLEIYGILGDEKGQFHIELPRQFIKMEISVVGMLPKTMDIDLTVAQNTIDLGIFNIETNIELDEVTVTAEALDYKLELDKKTYNVSKDLLSKGRNLAEVMENLPSVQVEVDGVISLRGITNIRILLDGEPSGFTNTANLLRTIPANSVERIEVITNPSSKYTSEGTGGIINVVLKKGKKKRLNSNIEVFSGYRLNSGLNVNINKGDDKSSWYINSGIGFSEPKATYEMTLQDEAGAIKKTHQYFEKILKQFYFLTNLGGQKKIGKNSTFSTDITYRLADAQNPSYLEYEDMDTLNNFYTSTRLDTEKINDHFFQANFIYKLNVNEKGATLKLRSNTQFNIESDISDILEEQVFPNPTLISKNHIPKSYKNKRNVFSLDYTHPLKNKARLELGLQYKWNNHVNEFKVESFINDVWSDLTEFTDQTNYRENIFAFYGQFAKSFEKLKLQIGLRGEYTDIEMSSMQRNYKQSIHYYNLFPSSFLSYEFNEHNSFRISFSQRIGRPSSSQFVPRLSLTDNRNIYKGNPELEPSFSTLIELGLKTYISANFSIVPTFYYSRRNHSIDNFFLQKESFEFNDQIRDFFVSQAINIGTNTAHGVELSSAYTVNKWLSMFCELRGNIFKQNWTYENIVLNSTGEVLHGRYHINLKFTKTFRFQIQNRFRSGNIRGQLSNKAVYRMDIGLSKSFNDKAFLALNIRDVFDTWAFQIDRTGEQFKQHITSQVRVPQLNVSFIYQFNQKQYQGKKGRQYDKLY